MVFLRRLVVMIVVAAAGLVIAVVTDLPAMFLPGSAGYLLIATVLLVIGLFSATSEVSRSDLLDNFGLVLNAVTFGVLFKAVLTGGAMYALFRAPEYLVLGVVVAQIDPLAVAVMRHGSRLSDKARAILSAWAAFDDPVTAILAIYLSTVAVSLSTSDRDDGNLIGILGGYSNAWLNVLFSVLLAVAAFGVWLGLRALARRQGGDPAKPATWPSWLRALAIAALLIAGAIAVKWFLMLSIAFVGLFFRPGIEAALRWVTPAALMVAVFMLGIVLAGDVNVVPGVVLGVAVFLAQAIVGGLIVTRSLPSRRDRWRLALSQQNGIAAIILALVLETIFPGFVAIVGPAILVIGVLYLASNLVLDRIEDARASTRKETDNRSTDVDGKGLEFRPEGS